VSAAPKVLIVASARPNFMKIAPIIRRIEALAEARAPGEPTPIDYRLVHTGQHYDANMSAIFFAELGIPAPHINLEVGSGSQAVQTGHVMIGFERACEEEKPDWVLVVGDVTPTMACTLVGAKLGIRVAHVEAGLRSFDRSMPEEINRLVTDALADLLLTPSPDADENLRREGVAETRIERVGNVMIDTLVANLDAARASGVLERLGLEKNAFVYVTLHRPANVDRPEVLAAIMAELRRIATDLPVVFPMHPRTRKACARLGLPLDESRGLRIAPPLGYLDSLCLADACRFVLTDSGGLQEETTYLRTPCLTLRPNTERPITVTVGSNRLTSFERLSADIDTLLSRPLRYGEVPPLWDGRAAERIVASLLAAG
jgi:UDP-N-acetylglucosamine 2-epimerase (non-hydrolysing)